MARYGAMDGSKELTRFEALVLFKVMTRSRAMGNSNELTRFSALDD
jgi:hypothetical protein